MRTVTKYLALQVPGWILVALILGALWQYMGLPLWVALCLFSLWVVKDLVLYRLIPGIHDATERTGVQGLTGARGVTREWLSPSGYVQVHGTLWRAEAEPRDTPIPPGSSVTVRRARGSTLIVTRDEESRSLSL